jgi:autotransporter-associated beta strand protein
VGAIPAGTSLVVNGGSFDLDGNNQSIANLSDGGVSTGSIIDSGGAATLNTSSSITTAFSGTINASNATLVVNGTGTANLSGVNSLASLVQNAGVINLSAANTIANTTVNVGTLTVSSTGSITGTGSVIIGDNGNMTVNGGSITAANFYTNSNGVSSTLLTGGAKLNLSGGLYIDNDNKSDQGLFQLSGGSIAATSILIGRTGFNGGTAAVLTAAPVNDGFYITSGTVNDSGTLDLGTNNVANSNAILRMDGGTLNVSGATIITDAGNNRLSTLDVNGGTFTTPSVQIGGNAGAAVGEAGELLVRGTGLANVGTITFGNSAQTVGPNVLELLGGTLYVGSGGIVNGGGSVTPTFNLGGTAYTTAPILAASAAWSSSVGITLTNSSNGTAPTIQAANSSGGAENITLTGGIGGAGGLIKTGAGTLYLAGAGNYYTGITTVNQGVLNINSEYALGGAVYGGLAFNGGTLQYANPLLNATTDVTFNGSGAVPVTIGAGGATIDTNGNSITFVDPIGNNGSGGLTVTDSVGTGVLTLLGTNTYHGATTINSGATLQLGDGVAGQDGTILTSSSIVDNGTLVYNRSGSLTSSVSITGSGSVVISGAGTQTLTGINQYTGGTNVSAGELVLASGSAFPAGVSNAGTGLIVAVGATLQIASHGSAVAFVPYVSSLNNSGTIDITNNGLVVRNGSIGTISSEVAAAYNNSAWNGTSGSIGIITSSTAAGDTTHLTAVGVATGLTSFEGATVSTSDVLVKYTYYGDANLDGHVDGTDYSRIDNGYLLGLTGWSNGDFNYDGVINGSDYTLIDNSYNTQGAALAAEIGGSTAVATAQIAGGGASAVPEPATFGLLGIGTVGLLGRRRRGTR